MADATGVLVVAQTAGEDLSSTGQELLEAGRRVADDLGRGAGPWACWGRAWSGRPSRRFKAAPTACTR